MSDTLTEPDTIDQPPTDDGRAKKRRRIVIIAAAVLAVILAVVVAMMLLTPKADPRLEDPPSAADISDMNVKSLDGDLVVESVGLAMPLSEMSVVGGVINPPELDQAYVVRDYAQPGDTEHMSVIALHSISSEDIPGNRLIDVDSAAATVSPGDSIVVQGHEYEVTSAYTQDKESASLDNALWEDRGGKLLLFTCLQLPEGGPTVDNVIVQAQLVE
jgi:hypothetical protein